MNTNFNKKLISLALAGVLTSSVAFASSDSAEIPGTQTKQYERFYKDTTSAMKVLDNAERSLEFDSPYPAHFTLQMMWLIANDLSDGQPSDLKDRIKALQDDAFKTERSPKEMAKEIAPLIEELKQLLSDK